MRYGRKHMIIYSMNSLAELEAQLQSVIKEYKRLDLEYVLIKQQIVENQLWQLRCKEVINRMRKEIEYEKSPYRFNLFRKLT